MSKQSKHEERKSYKKWGQTGQLVASVTTPQHRLITTNKKQSRYAMMHSRMINFLPKSSHPRGDVVGLVLPQDYHPEKKAPSRRDKHRAEVSNRKN